MHVYIFVWFARKQWSYSSITYNTFLSTNWNCSKKFNCLKQHPDIPILLHTHSSSSTYLFWKFTGLWLIILQVFKKHHSLNLENKSGYRWYNRWVLEMFFLCFTWVLSLNSTEFATETFYILNQHKWVIKCQIPFYQRVCCVYILTECHLLLDEMSIWPPGTNQTPSYNRTG